MARGGTPFFLRISGFRSVRYLLKHCIKSRRLMMDGRRNGGGLAKNVLNTHTDFGHALLRPYFCRK